jgi:hypothetical protein
MQAEPGSVIASFDQPLAEPMARQHLKGPRLYRQCPRFVHSVGLPVHDPKASTEVDQLERQS